MSDYLSDNGGMTVSPSQYNSVPLGSPQDSGNTNCSVQMNSREQAGRRQVGHGSLLSMAPYVSLKLYSILRTVSKDFLLMLRIGNKNLCFYRVRIRVNTMETVVLSDLIWFLISLGNTTNTTIVGIIPNLREPGGPTAGTEELQRTKTNPGLCWGSLKTILGRK